jgi:hypothetical protein
MGDEFEVRYAEVDIPGGHVTKKGNRIGIRALIPDNDYAYGDSESVALMAGDLAALKSSDSMAGDKAYADAKEQMETTDWAQKKQDMREQRFKAKRPMLNLWEARTHDGLGMLVGLHILTAWGKSPWDPNLEPRMDYIEFSEMDLVEMEVLYGASREYIYGVSA